MENDKAIENSLVVEGEENIIDQGMELLCCRSRRMLWLAVRDGRRIVLKGLPEELRTHPEDIASLRKEYLLCLRLEDRGIIRVYGFEDHPQAGPVIVMEYIDGIPLNVYLYSHEGESSRLPELSERRKIAFEIAKAISSMHKAGISHRDLKPDNILITAKERSPRIIDFGNGDAEDFVIYKQSVGTERYGAPEQKEPSEGGMHGDVYSFGKILDELLPEWRFKSLRKACEEENPLHRPDMESVARRLDPSRFSHRKTTLGITGVAVAVLIAFVVWYGGKSAMADPKDTVGKKESVVTDKLPGHETTENLGEPEEPENTLLSDDEIKNGAGKENIIPPMATEEKTVVKTIVVKDTTDLDGIVQKYIKAADKIILRYGKLGYDEKTRESHTEETLKRGKEQFKLSDEMEKELVDKGFNEAQRSTAYHSLWTYMINENNKIDGNYELAKKLMQKQSEEKTSTP